ncbi:MAG: sensor histidine kinase [Blautia sp.]|nr:sensor histidine kinase [Blautia sp.]
MLYHVWSNLINNAIKYSPQGGEIHIGLQAKESGYLFSIEDHGPGISEKNLGHIFEKFFQEDTAHKKEGNGLGLAQVKQILDLLGGTVEAKSDGRSGSTFLVRLP